MAFSLGTLTPPKVMVTPELAAPAPPVAGGLPPAPGTPPEPTVAPPCALLPPRPATPIAPAAPPSGLLGAPPKVLLGAPPAAGGAPAPGMVVPAPAKGPKSPLVSTACTSCGCSTTPQAIAPATRLKTRDALRS